MGDLRQLLQLTRWRVVEFVREPEAVFWVVAFPILLALALGVAFANRGPATIRVGVESGVGAAELAAVLEAAPGLAATVFSPDDAATALRTGRVPLVVRAAAVGGTVTFRYDSTREESYLARVVADDAIQRAAGRTDPQAVVHERVTERGARYIDFLIPGLIGLNIMGTGMWGVGFAIVRTRSKKLLKRFLASPMRRSHFLLGHMFARLVFLFVEVGVVLLFGVIAFGVPVRGSLAVVAVVSVVGALTFSGLGILVASRAQTIEGVSGLMNVVMVPMWILSGVFFSAALFPDLMQPFVRALPLTALNDALRGVMLEGASLVAIAGSLGVLGLWCVGTFGVALRIFRWR